MKTKNNSPERCGVFLTLTLALLFIGMGAAPSTARHPYHVSLAEIEWNSEKETFEIALCVWPADLEKSLSKLEGKPVDLDKVEKLDSKILRLIERDFLVSDAEGKLKTVRWVGHEKSLKEAWLYFEIESVKRNETITLRNRLFFDLNEDQLNQVNSRFGRSKKQHLLNREQPEFSTAVGLRR